MKIKYRLIVNKLLSTFLLFIYFFYTFSPILLNPGLVFAATTYTAEFTAIEDTFVSPLTLNPANGTRRMMPIGSYTDYTIAGNPLFSRSRALVKFSPLTLPAGAIITDVKLRLWHYGSNSGHDSVFVTKITSGWNESTVNPGPSADGINYGNLYFPMYNSDANAVARDITIDSALYSYLQSSNNGLMIRNFTETASGVVVCSSEIPSGPCKSGMQPRLIVSYIVNQIPNQPNLDTPLNGWLLGPSTNGVYSGTTCDTTGTGLGCSVDFRTNAQDPDDTFPLTNIYEVRSSEGGNADFTNSGEGWQNTSRILTDGHWSWKGYSVDTYGGNSGYSPSKSFIVDTTSPTVPILNSEPVFTAGVQNTVSSSVVTDAIDTNPMYLFQVSSVADFSTVDFDSGWVSSNSYTFAGLTDGQTYYYRASSKDSLDNISNWSLIESSTQDATLPSILNISLSESIISSSNQDSLFDESTISFDYADDNILEAKVEIYNSSTTLVNQQTFSSLILPIDTLTYTWDGKDSANNFVADDSYNIVVTLTDKAGNVSMDNSLYIVVDNTSPNLTITSPATGAWMNSSTVNITGQTEIGSNATLYLCDDSICTTETFLTNISLDSAGIFSVTSNLTDGPNYFKILSEDLVNNRISKEILVYKESKSPVININVSAQVNDRRPVFEFEYIDGGVEVDSVEYKSGYVDSSVNISLNNGIVLVANGVNTQPSLGHIDSTCSDGAVTCIYKYVFDNEFQPDGIYEITGSFGDRSQNNSGDNSLEFEIDSHTLLEQYTLTDGQLFNYSKILLAGRAEQGSTLSIQVAESDGDGLADTETFLIEEASTFGRVSVTNCVDSTSPLSDGIKRVCDWQVTDFSLEKNLLDTGAVANAITFQLTDSNNNTTSINKNVSVDLYAVNLSFDTSNIYFSPNGDGRQDGLEFKNLSTDGQVDNWELLIIDSTSTTVMSFSGVSTLPSNIPWDGRGLDNEFVTDGQYDVLLNLTTTDGITFTAGPRQIKAVTQITNEVIITYPDNDTYTTKGVTNVQGQAPLNTKIRICDDVVGIAGECDFSYEDIEVDANGSFSTIVPLFRLDGINITQHYLYAVSYDQYGNVTSDSNKIKISVTNQNPFNSVAIIPAFSGVNNEADYQIILDKLANGLEITQTDIASLRSVVIRSNVNQGTERVKLAYNSYTNLSELPELIQFYNIGYITGDNATHLYSTYQDGVSAYTICATTDCTWDFVFPIAPGNGGIFEIEFDGKLGSTIQTQTASFVVDANIPTAPMVLQIDKVLGSQNLATNKFENKYYSNSSEVVIKGIADPNATITLIDSLGNDFCSTTANSIGFWSCQTDFGVTNGEFIFTVEAVLAANSTLSLESSTIVIDTIAPSILELNTANQWRKAGDVTDLHIVADESLSYAIHKDRSGNLCANDSWSSSALTGLDLSTNRTEAIGSIILSGNLINGKYCSQIEIKDLAGNVFVQEFELFIDNEVPEIATIDTSTWGIYNGKDAQDGFISLGRLNPEYVTNDATVTIYGLAEENLKIDLYVDGEIVATSYAFDESSSFCLPALEPELNPDGVVVRSGYLCPYFINYTFDKGEKGYNFQVKALDFSGNTSLISEDELIYLDTTPPQTPETMKVTANGKQIVDWQYAKDTKVNAVQLGTGNFGKLPITNQKIIAVQDYAESLSDIVYSSVAPNGALITQVYNKKSGNGVNDRSADLQKGDGVYTFYSQSWDAPGNISAVHMFQIELDTIAPVNPKVSVQMSGMYSIFMSVQGEPGAYSTLGKLPQNGYASGIMKTLDINNDSDWERWFTYCSTLTDRAENKSGSVCASVKTPVRPPRPNECVMNLEWFNKSDGSNCFSDDSCNIDEVFNNYTRSCKHYYEDELRKQLSEEITKQVDYSKKYQEVIDCISSSTQSDTDGKSVVEKCEENRVKLDESQREDVINQLDVSFNFSDCLKDNMSAKCEYGKCDASDSASDLWNECSQSSGFIPKTADGDVDWDQIDNYKKDLTKNYGDLKDQYKRADYDNCHWTWTFWEEGSCLGEVGLSITNVVGDVVGGAVTLVATPFINAYTGVQQGISYVDSFVNGKPFESVDTTRQRMIDNYTDFYNSVSNGANTVLVGTFDLAKSVLIDMPLHMSLFTDALIFSFVDWANGGDSIVGDGSIGAYYDEGKRKLKDDFKLDIGDVRDDLFKAVTAIVITVATIFTGGFAAGVIGAAASATAVAATTIITGLVLANLLGLVSAEISMLTGLGQVDQLNAICQNPDADSSENEDFCTDGEFDQGKYMEKARHISGDDVKSQLCGVKDPSVLECIGNQVGMFAGGSLLYKVAQQVPGVKNVISSLENISKQIWQKGYGLGEGINNKVVNIISKNKVVKISDIYGCRAGTCGELGDNGDPLCFVKGTLVKTNRGLVPIEQVKVGERVLSRDVNSVTQRFETVTKQIETFTDYIIEINIGDEIIKSTPAHVVFTVNRGWIQAENLVAGDVMSTSLNHNNKIVSVRKVFSPQIVYNLEVENSHTYFVGKSEVLVHNACIKMSDLPVDDPMRIEFVKKATVAELKAQGDITLLNQKAELYRRSGLLVDDGTIILNDRKYQTKNFAKMSESEQYSTLMLLENKLNLEKAIPDFNYDKIYLLQEENSAGSRYIDLYLENSKTGIGVEIKHLITNTNLNRVNANVITANEQLRANGVTKDNGLIILDLSNSQLTIDQAFKQIDSMKLNQYKVMINKFENGIYTSKLFIQ